MPLVLGLGNPGERYARTRHNLGWRVVERLVSRWRAVALDSSGLYRAWRAEPGGSEVWLMAPLTFMNASGGAIEKWREQHVMEAGELLVLVDDVYLPLGRLRLRGLGSSGGHLGLESLEASLGTREWSRLRIGVGAAASAATLREHVLEEFGSEDAPVVESLIERAADAAECWCREGLVQAMNRYNRPEEEVPES